jgi:tRNA-2-methylthio-N6-dimethylallyladenosine synthase
MKNLYIKTFGCQMNEYDSKRFAHILAPIGYEMNDDIQAADLIILNTCSIRHKAEHKVYSLLGRLKGAKRKNSELIIAVGGCVAQQEGKKILSRNPHINLVFGTKSVANLPSLITDIEKTGKRYVDVSDSSRVDGSLDDVVTYYKDEPKAAVSIITGCDNFCSYCIVPYVRGREESRPVKDILKEVAAHVESGAREIILLGQNVNSYSDLSNGNSNFPALLKKVASVNGLKRLRFMTSHPKDMSDELIECFGELDNLCNYMHLPIQSGSDSVLERMNRKYTRDAYLDKVDKLKKVCHNISISTDIIVGFPGESERDFEDTLDVIREVGYDNSFSFKYSSRPGTKAAELDDNVDNAEKASRLNELQNLQKEIILSKNNGFEGKTVDVLVEGPSKTNETLLTGRTTCNRIVNFSGNKALVGKIISVNIIKGFMNSLKGELAEHHK